MTLVLIYQDVSLLNYLMIPGYNEKKRKYVNFQKKNLKNGGKIEKGKVKSKEKTHLLQTQRHASRLRDLLAKVA